MNTCFPFMLLIILLSSSSTFAICPNKNYLCADKNGNSIHFCEKETTGPWSCCPNAQSSSSNCPPSHPFGPYLHGSSEYKGHEMRQFKKAAIDDTLDIGEYHQWMNNSHRKISITALTEDFDALDKNEDQQISLEEFIAFRQSSGLSPVTANSSYYSTRVILLLLFIVIGFCTLSTVVYINKISSLR